jgi:MYXO-CTERM domain-containing protein
MGSPNNGTAATDYGNNGRRGTDWGWLGLIGLAGLAGLMRRRNEDVTVTSRDRSTA